MAVKRKTAPTPGVLVATSAILIDGRHFDPGAVIEGVSAGEVNKAVAIGRVAPAAAAAPGSPATETEGKQAKD